MMCGGAVPITPKRCVPADRVSISTRCPGTIRSSPTADRGESQEPLLIDPLDDEPDLVGVRIEEQHAVARAAPHGDQVAERVDANLVDVRFDHRLNLLSNLVFEPRDAERVGQFAQNIEWFHGCSPSLEECTRG